MGIGVSVRRVDAEAKVTGAAKYVEDLIPRDALYVKVIHSTVANGLVIRVDTAEAEAGTAGGRRTGKGAGMARSHPAMKGVRGGQAAGAALVSFNAPAFCSYGHEQGANAPVSEYAAFAYTTALNLLLADRNCCQRIGDTTIVCWAENAAPAYSNAMLMFFCGGAEARGISESDLAAALKALSQ